jgi:hypothetical protein
VGHDVSENWVNFSHNSTRIAPREVLAGFDTRHNTPPFKSRHHPNSRIARLKQAARNKYCQSQSWV